MSNCSIKDCGNPFLAKGFCNKHYQRYKIHADANRVIKRVRGVCSVPECGNPNFCHGYCIKHFSKIRTTGTLEKIQGTPEYRKRISESLKSELTRLDKHKDPKRRGYLAVNTVNDIKFKARQRNKSWQLTNMEAYKMIIDACHYCGYKPNWPRERIGIDRIDSKKGYALDNCLPCCFVCNSAKAARGYGPFKAWLSRLKTS